ncbi:MAG: PaaI family thioesterase [Clostridia bacterium]|nr:PaaI family thioesterase [Clostridia bacterium]
MEVKITRQHNNSAMCVVCGMSNGLSLRTKFYTGNEDLIIGILKGRDEHQSYPNRMHGGLISALLDEVIGRAVNIDEPDTFGVTTELNVKFKKPVPLNEEIRVVGKIPKNTRLVYVAEGCIEDVNGKLLATGTGTYFKQPIAKIAGKPLSPEEWFLDLTPLESVNIENLSWFDRER